MKNAIIDTFNSYNERRYSAPWVSIVDDTGKLNFSVRCGTYTGNSKKGEAGDLVVFEPKENQVYGYGQKDYRGNNTEIHFAKWNGETFDACDKLGKLLTI